jgi:DNA-binding NarL/FixJ family response regulator
MSSSPKIRILIADDHYIVRIGLIALVSTEPDMKIVAEAENGIEAVELCATHKPDLVLIDSRMPFQDGIEATIDIRKKFPSIKILMLTAHDGDADIRRALEAGANGYVLKRSTGEELIPALRAVSAGERWVPAEVARKLASRKSFEQLTRREVEVLGEMSKGLPNKLIADSLGISEHTVKDHVKNVLGKLQVGDRTEAVTAGLERGIIRLPS